MIGLLAGSAVAQDLTWAELVRRPEHWPAQCTIKRAMNFQSGDRVAAGAQVFEYRRL